MNLIWVVAGFIGLLWLPRVLVRRGRDDGEWGSGVKLVLRSMALVR